jgi:hypothetical protein
MRKIGKIRGNCIEFRNGEIYPISKHNKNHGLDESQEVEANIDTEYPEQCDNNPFCEGDETCVICLNSNKVANIVRVL